MRPETLRRPERPDNGETSMDTEDQGAAPGAAAGTPAERRTRSRTAWRTRSRWFVHLGLLACAAAALGTLQLLHIRNAIHADMGLAFASLVIVHLVQRRHRIGRCSRSSAASADGSLASYVSWRQMRSSHSSRSTSSFLGSSRVGAPTIRITTLN
jgi:hypothetical protein